MSMRRALVVRGGWEGHSPEAVTDEFIGFLAERDFEVVVEDSLEAYADLELMRSLSLVVQSWTQGDILADEFRGLRDAVTAGVGFAGWHGGVLDAFRQTAEYSQMLGGVFAAHPHGMVTHRVELTDAGRDHPITTGIGAFELVSEQYWVLVDSLSTVLAQTAIAPRAGDPWQQPYPAPVAWTRQWGLGRIFVSTLGHGIDDLRIPQVRTLTERGLLWAAR
ncbi:MAG: ThuA domain-containing protein [Propionibacteriaceae bacterium]|nr:ThuA domain-containing protein [Propionibacteriaceae bacterium]